MGYDWELAASYMLLYVTIVPKTSKRHGNSVFLDRGPHRRLYFPNKSTFLLLPEQLITLMQQVVLLFVSF